MSSVEYQYAEDFTTTHETSDRTIWLLLVVAVGAVALLVILGAWMLLASRPPGDDSVEAGFARDMAEHHDQAVEMALIIQQRTEDEELRIMATDIMLTQQAQIGQMRGWLDVWGLRFAGTAPQMEWMGHPVTGRMPGMASPDEIDQIRELPIDDAEELFLRLMIVHHQAGVEMADAALERTDNDAVSALATAISQAQVSEIEYMQELLERKGFERIPVEQQITDHDDHD